MVKNCDNCACNYKNSCIALTEKVEGKCDAWADKKGLEQRLKDISRYREKNGCRHVTPTEVELLKVIKELKK